MYVCIYIYIFIYINLIDFCMYIQCTYSEQ